MSQFKLQLIFRLLQHVRGLVKMWAERKRFGRTSAMAPRPPPPRAAMLYLYVTNLLLLASALAVVASGAFSVLVPGGAAARASLAEMQGNPPADTAARLLEEYAPATRCICDCLRPSVFHLARDRQQSSRVVTPRNVSP